MKAKSINVQIVKNLGNYESIRIGGEWELNSENLQDAIRAAAKELEQVWIKLKTDAQSSQNHTNVEIHTKEVKTPQIAENGKKLCRFKEESKILQAIVTRVQNDKSVTLETVCEHYELDDDALKCVEAAIKLRG